VRMGNSMRFAMSEVSCLEKMGSVEGMSTPSKCGLLYISWSPMQLILTPLDSYADGLLSSWRRFVIVREKVVGDMAEVVHVEVLASGRIDAQSHLAMGDDRTSPVMELSGFGSSDGCNALVWG